MLLNIYGFSLEKNPFAVKNFYFSFIYQNKEWFVDLHEKETKKLIDIVIKVRNENKLDKVNNDQIRENDVKVFEEILKSLKIYSNKKRIQDLKNNLKDTPNTLNIYRALVAEDNLIDKNVEFLNDIIKLLKGGKIIYEQNFKNPVVMQNQGYFKNLFS